MNWIRLLFRRPHSSGRAGRPRTGSRSRPAVEILEERVLLSAGGVTEYPLPAAAGRPAHIVAGPDGNLWFTDQGADPGTGSGKIGRITPGGVIKEFALPTHDALPADITVGPDGNLWFTEHSTITPARSNIGRITPSGTITEFTLPVPLNDVNSLNPDTWANAITTGPDGNLWFTDPGNGLVGRITTGGQITEFAIPEAPDGPGVSGPNTHPNGITAGPDGNLWFTATINTYITTYAGVIGRITPGGTFLTTTNVNGLPSDINNQEQPGAIVTGPDGNVWVAENPLNPSPGNSQVEVFTTTGKSTEYPLTAVGSLDGLAVGPDGRLWALDASNNQLVRLGPDGSVRATFAVPTTGSGLAGIAAGPQSTVWFTESYTGKIGVVSANSDPNLLFIQAVYQDLLGRPGTLAEWNAWDPVLVAQGEAGLVRAIASSAEANDRLVSTWYTTLLGRQPQGGEEQGFANALQGGATPEQLIALLLGSPEFYAHAPQVPGVGGSPSPQAFVKAVYHLLFNRAPRPDELAALTSPAATQMGSLAIVQGLLRTAEYRGLQIGRLYQQFLHRAGSAAEVNAWVGSGLDLGTIAGYLESSYEKFALNAGGPDDNQHFIQVLYQRALDRAASPAEAASWEQALLRYGSAVVVRAIERSPESTEEGVRSLYQSLLGRAPVNGEEQGFVNALLAGTMTEEQVMAALVGSDEFLARATGLVGPAQALANWAFIQGLYEGLLQRAPQPAEVAYWLGLVPLIGRAGVAWYLLEAPEFRIRLIRLFFAEQHRPTPPADAEVNAWVYSGLTLEVVDEALQASYSFYLYGSGA